MASSSSLSSNKMMITETDSYQTILAWKELEQKRYHPRRSGLDSSSSSFLLLNKNIEQLSIWCFNVVEHFHLPQYLVEWTMNFIHRYADAAANDINTTSTLKIMTAVALRLCIRLDAGQCIYSRHRRPSENHPQHMVAMMTIPHLVARQEDNNPSTTVIYCVSQMFVKLELILMRTLGFYLYPPLTEHYIEEISKIVEYMASKENIVADNKLLLEQIKTRAVFLAQKSSLVWNNKSNQASQPLQSLKNRYYWNIIENNENSINKSSSCNVALLSYLTALNNQVHISTATCSSKSSSFVSECCNKWYSSLMDTFVDIIVVDGVASSSLSNETKMKVLQERMDVVLSLSAEADYHEDAIIKNPTQSYDDSSSAVLTEVTPPRLSSHHKKRNGAINCLDVVNNINSNHHQHTSQKHHRHSHTAAATTLTTSPIVSLGKRKASPTSVIMCSNGDDTAVHK